MKARPGSLLIATLPLALAIIAACGDGGDHELTLEEYLQRVHVLDADSDAAVQMAVKEFDETVAGAEADEEIVDAFGDFMDALISAGQEEFDEQKKLDPPAEVEDLHESMVTSIADALELLDDLKTRSELAESESDVAALQDELSGPEVSEIVDRAREARCALQTIADDSGLDVDVGCEE